MTLNPKRKRGKETPTGLEKVCVFFAGTLFAKFEVMISKRRQVVDDDCDSSLAEPEGDMNDRGGESELNGGDDEPWGGFGDELSENESDAPASAEQAESHTRKKERKPPTGEELRAIKDATDLFRSSSFKLQVSLWNPSLFNC
jgi:U3 small nucleolar RNA-associated protein 22